MEAGIPSRLAGVVERDGRKNSMPNAQEALDRAREVHEAATAQAS